MVAVTQALRCLRIWERRKTMMRTFGDMMRDAQACSTKDEATALVANEIAGLIAQSPLLLEEQAREIVLKNIGYMSGYCERAEAARILDLFETRHPYFGAIENWPKTPEETLEMGMKLGLRRKSQAPEHLSTGESR
jgi:hypothetical protein